MVPGTENKVFFKFGLDPSGTVFTGGKDDLGYFSADSTGHLQFVSLLEYLPDSLRSFGTIQTISTWNGDLFFQSRHYLFQWDGTTLTTHKPPKRFYRVFNSSDRLFVDQSPVGLSEFNGKEFVAISNDEWLRKRNIRGVVDLNFEGDQLLVATKYKGLCLVENGVVSRLNPELDSLVIFNTTELPNGNIALATNGQGIYIVDQFGEVVNSFDESRGLAQDQVTYAYVGNGGGLWASTYSGLSRIEYPSPISFFGKNEGLSGIPICAAHFNDQLFVGTTNAGFQLTIAGGNAALNPTDWGDNYVWSLANFGDRLLISLENGLFQQQQNGTIESIGAYPDAIAIPSLSDTGNWFVGKKNGVSLLNDENGSWTDRGVIAEVDHEVISMAQESENRLWISYQKISYLDFSTGLTTPTVVTLDSTHSFTSEMGICEATRLGDEVVFGTDKGLYRFDHSTQKLVPDDRFGKRFCDGSTFVSDITPAPDGTVWLSTRSGTGPLYQRDGKWEQDTLALKRAPISDVHGIFHHPEDGTVWVFATEGVIRYDPSVSVDYDQQWTAMIRSVRANGDSLLYAGHLPESWSDPVLTYDNNQVSFTYAAGYFEAIDKLQFSHQLVGQDAGWSEWHATTSSEYTNLAEGEYTFRVKARNVYGSESEIASWSFTVLPPWYRTTWAIVLWGVLGAFALLALLRLNSLRLIRAKKRLETIVTERTEEITQQKNEIEGQKEEIEVLLEAKEEALFRAEASEKAKELFLANMSHEIRTPLNAVIGFTEILRKEQHTDRQEEFLETIQSSGENLLVIINDILDFSKIEAGKLEIESIPFELNSSMRNCEAMLRPKAEENGLEFSVDVDPGIPPVLMGDPVRLSQILINLVNNAIKFTEKGAVTVMAKLIDSTEEKAQVEFAVTDTGIGIAPDKVDSIFESFTQAGSDTARKFGGTGLGTTIVKRLVDLQDGQVSLTSEVGKGSTFTVSLPFAISAMAPEDLVTAESGTGPFHPKPLQGTVLVADDNKVNRRLAKEVLSDFGLEVDFATNGREVIDLHLNNDYDLILMDLQMPEMDGAEATIHIRNELERSKSRIPIVGMTAHFLVIHQQRCLEAGMQDHVSKPFRQQELYDVLLDYLPLAPEGSEISRSEPEAPAEPSPAQQAAPATDSLVNLDYLNKLSKGNPAFVIEMLEMVRTDTTRDLEQVNALAEKEEWTQVGKAVHKSSSSLVMLGNEELIELFTSVEKLCEENADAESILQRLAGLQDYWSHVRSEVDRFLKSIEG